MELLRAVAAELRFPGPDEDPVTFAETPTVTVTRDSTGATVFEGPAEEHAGEDDDPTYYTVELSGSDLSEVDLLSAVWSDGNSSYTTYAEVVGGFACSLKAIEAKYGEDDKSTEEIAAMRMAATRAIEGACGVAFRPRYGREVRDGSGTTELFLAAPQLQRVLSASVAGEDLALDDLTADPVGAIVSASSWPTGRLNVRVTYVHGYTDFSPAALPVRDLAAYLLTESPTDWNERATAVSNEFGNYTLVVPGMRGASFPLPAVNAFVEDNHFVSVG